MPTLFVKVDGGLHPVKWPDETLPHAATHSTGGSDPILPEDIGAATQSSLDELQDAVNALSGTGGYISAYDFGTATPTQEALCQYASEYIWKPGGTWTLADPITESTYVDVNNDTHYAREIFPNTRVQNLNNLHTWALTNTPNTEPPVFDWADKGFDSVGPASETEAGIVRPRPGDGLGIDANGDLWVRYGDEAGTSAQGNDPRLSDSRTPTLHASTHGVNSSDPLTAADIDAVSVTDPRLSDARTPTTHAATHATTGSDPITAESIRALPINTLANYCIDPVDGNDATGRPETSSNFATPFKTWVAAKNYAASVFNGVGDLVFAQKAGTTCTESVAFTRMIPGSYGRLYIRGMDATSKISPVSGIALRLYRITCSTIVVQALTVESTTGGDGLRIEECSSVVSVDAVTFGNANRALFSLYNSGLVYVQTNTFAGACTNAISVLEGGTVFQRNNIVFTDGFSASDCTLNVGAGSKYTAFGSTGASSVAPNNKRWNVAGELLLAYSGADPTKYGTVAGTVTNTGVVRPSV